jgi:hypothetical protein
MKEKSKKLQQIALKDAPESKRLEGITDKQKAFVQKIILEGLAPIDAYMAVYKVTSRQSASSSAYKLLKKDVIKQEVSLQITELKSLSNVPKHLIVDELKKLLTNVSTSGDTYNPKYIIEALDMMNKMMGYYNHVNTNVTINIDKKLDFGGFDPDAANYIDITPIE